MDCITDKSLLIELRNAVNDSARTYRTVFIIFLLLHVYFLAVAISVDHIALFKDAILQIPILNLGVKTSVFFLLAPAIILLLYLALLVQAYALVKKMDAYRNAMVGARGYNKMLGTLPFQVISGQRHGPIFSWVLYFMVVMMLILLPIGTLTFIMWKFLPYQDAGISLMHTIAIIIGIVMAISFYWMLPAEKKTTRPLRLGYEIITGAIIGVILSLLVFFAFPLFVHLVEEPSFESASRKSASRNFFYANGHALSVNNERLYKEGERSPLDVCSEEDPTFGLKLVGRSYIQANLSSSILCHARLAAAQLREAVLVGAQLQGADLSFAELQGADLSGAELQGAYLSDAQLQGADLSGAELQGADLYNAQLQGAYLSGAELQGAYLSDAQLQEAALSGAELQGAYLYNAQLQGAALSYAQLQGADLSGAELQGADLSDAQLQGADLSGAELQGAYLYNAQLQGADLSGAQLQGADLYGAQLQGAYLCNAQLQGAVLYGAQLQGTDLSDAELQGVFSTSQIVEELSELTFKERIRARVDQASDLSDVVFSGEMEQKDIERIVEELEKAKWEEERIRDLKERLEPHTTKEKSNQLPKDAGAIIGKYNQAEADKWIQEYQQALAGEYSQAEVEELIQEYLQTHGEDSSE